ncbi:hypothetical protein K505DRAFT_396808 [Melanomma pulvis-pyrius CBS 109.77]|uniref:Uncharacterized protein n=1 Tax=Melanomma pulvis-pyrius CBS 109.77 TaxID=1314802 RepID=A0A6A6XNF9_9PLEO|nr:hypothetical protein K505DRAFT_396808 [Melanomma pulvis-pyrius CBS 109.77]
MREISPTFNRPTAFTYSTLCLLSVLSAAIHQILVHRGPLLPFSKQPPVARLLHPSISYPITLDSVVVFLQKHAAIGDPTPHHSNAQIWAIHFAASFFVLSGCEYYRHYLEFKQLECNLEGLLAALFRANLDDAFRESRDAFNYMIRMPGDPSFTRNIRAAIHHPPFYFLFYVAAGCFNYLIKRMANPSSLGEDFMSLASGSNVFFTSANKWVAFLDFFVLQRPVRLLNRLLFWGCVDLVKRACAR